MTRSEEFEPLQSRLASPRQESVEGRVSQTPILRHLSRDMRPLTTVAVSRWNCGARGASVKPPP